MLIWPVNTHEVNSESGMRHMTTFGTEMRRLMTERGISLRGLARITFYDVGGLSKISRDLRPPSPKMAAALDDALDAGGQLVALAPPAAAHEEIDDELELIELTRRAEASDVGAGTLEAIDVAVDRLCRDYPTAPAAQLRARSDRALRYVLRLLDGRTTLAQHRELLVDAGWLAALLGCVAYDVGARDQAETARRLAYRLGDQAGHAEIVAWSWEMAAWFALTDRRFQDVVDRAEGGLERAGITSGAVQLTLQAARGYARMRDRRAVEMLRAGKQILDQLPRPDHPEHHFVFDATKYEFYVASILTWLGGDDDAAEEHAREVLARSWRPGEPERWPMRAAYVSVDLGLIAGRRRDLDEAVEHGRLALAPARRSADLLPRAGELHRDLEERYPGERLVDEYGEILREEQRALPPPETLR